MVRGFDGLTDEQRAELLAYAADHDIVRASFTPEGHLSYDIAARDAFTFRFQETGDAEEDTSRPARGRRRRRRRG